MMGFPNDPTFYGDDLPPMPRPLNKPGVTVTHPDQDDSDASGSPRVV